MKTDILTVAAVVFVIGVLVTSIVGSDIFNNEQEPPAALQQGIAIR